MVGETEKGLVLQSHCRLDAPQIDQLRTGAEVARHRVVPTSVCIVVDDKPYNHSASIRATMNSLHRDVHAPKALLECCGQRFAQQPAMAFRSSRHILAYHLGLLL